MVLWLPEALQVPTSFITEAVNSAVKQPNLSGKCAAIRKVIPWHMIEERLG
jgi:hypothetical protein